MSQKICLITPSHISNNPRIVKEANTLSDAGYDVTVCFCQYMDDVVGRDIKILENAGWKAKVIDWRKDSNPVLFWKSRLRKYFFTILYKIPLSKSFLSNNTNFVLYAYDRVLPELKKTVLDTEADLFIAHNLQALPIAFHAAEKFKAKVGFDAEDFYSGMYRENEGKSLNLYLTKLIEQRYINKCDYITAASPGIGDAYSKNYEVQMPQTILNVFPLSMCVDKLRIKKAVEPLRLFWFSQTIGSDRGLEDIIRAMGILKNINIELHILGKWQNEYKNKLFSLVEEVGLDESKIVHHKPIEYDNIIKMASKFDIGLALEQPVSLNRDICLTNKIFTYMLAGCGIIATNTKGQSEFIKKHQLYARNYNPGDIKDLSEILRHWSVDCDDLNKYRRKLLEAGKNFFNWEEEKSKYLSVINNVLN